MRLLAAVVACALALSLAGCASLEASGPEAPQREKDAAMMALVECLYNNARKLDDGRSDAKTVALAVEVDCYSEFHHSVDVYSEGWNPETLRGVHAQEDAHFLQIATDAVLRERAQRH